MYNLVLKPYSDKLRDTGLAREKLLKETMTTLFARIDRVVYIRTQWADRVCGVGIFTSKIHCCESFRSRGAEYVGRTFRCHALIGASKISRKESFVGCPS